MAAVGKRINAHSGSFSCRWAHISSQRLREALGWALSLGFRGTESRELLGEIVGQKLFEALPVCEQKDFESACKRHGRLREEFTIAFDEDAPHKEGESHILRQVTVAANLTGARQTYTLGSGASWTVEFERDLARGFFWETYD